MGYNQTRMQAMQFRNAESSGKDCITIPCSRCEGTGRVVVTGIYAATFNLLRKQIAPMSGKELSAIAKCSNEAMCNRLVALEAFGLATSFRDGVRRFWTAKR